MRRSPIIPARIVLAVYVGSIVITIGLSFFSYEIEGVPGSFPRALDNALHNSFDTGILGFATICLSIVFATGFLVAVYRHRLVSSKQLFFEIFTMHIALLLVALTLLGTLINTWPDVFNTGLPVVYAGGRLWFIHWLLRSPADIPVYVFVAALGAAMDTAGIVLSTRWLPGIDALRPSRVWRSILFIAGTFVVATLLIIVNYPLSFWGPFVFPLPILLVALIVLWRESSPIQTTVVAGQ